MLTEHVGCVPLQVYWLIIRYSNVHTLLLNHQVKP